MTVFCISFAGLYSKCISDLSVSFDKTTSHKLLEVMGMNKGKTPGKKITRSNRVHCFLVVEDFKASRFLHSLKTEHWRPAFLSGIVIFITTS